MESTADCTSTNRSYSIIDDTFIKKRYRLTDAQTDFKTDIERRRSGWHRIYWLDESKAQNSMADYGIDRRELRGAIDYLEIYTITSEYVNKIEQTEKDDEQIIAIITVLNNAYLIEKIHSLSQVHSIYIYISPTEESSNIDQNSLRWYPKVKGVFNQETLLMKTLSCTMRQLMYPPVILQRMQSSGREQKKEFTVVPYKICQRDPSRDWFNTFLNVLQENKPISTGKKLFCDHCRVLFAHEPRTLTLVNYFESNYSAEQAIKWYTREGFLYHLLNRALRKEDCDLITLLHFFIFDLEQQLLAQRKDDDDFEWVGVEVYRGQLMSMDEINILSSKNHGSMRVSSFLSTTIDPEVATMFSGAGSYTKDSLIQPVMFRMNCDTFRSTRGVANIQHLSYNEDEGEILLSPLHILTLHKIYYDDERGLYNVECTVRGDRHDMRTDLDQRLIELDVVLGLLQQEHHTSDGTNEEECSLFTRDVMLLRQELILPKMCSVYMDVYNLGETPSNTFHLRHLQSFSSSYLQHTPHIRPDIAATLQDCLGTLYMSKGQFQCALARYEKAGSYGDTNDRKEFTRRVNMAQTYKMMGNHLMAWKITQNLLEENDSIGLYNLYTYITFAMPVLEQNYTPIQWFRKTYEYLEYIREDVSSSTDESDDESKDSDDDLRPLDDNLSDAYGTLGYYFWSDTRDSEYALLCYDREMSLTRSRMIDAGDETILVDLAGIYQRMADVHYETDVVKAIELYNQAIDIYSAHEESNSAELAVCWSRIGYVQTQTQLEFFRRAFQFLLLPVNSDIYDLKLDEISECYFYLAQTYATSSHPDYKEWAWKWSQQAIHVYLISDSRRSDIELSNYIDLLQKILPNDDPSKKFTKEQFLEHLSSNGIGCSVLENHQIRQMLQETSVALSNFELQQS